MGFFRSLFRKKPRRSDVNKSPANRSPEIKTNSVPTPQTALEPYSPKAAQKLFESYADADDKSTIGAEGFERLFTDAGLPLDGALPLLLAWQLSETEMAKLTEENWVKGMAELRISCLRALEIALNELQDLVVLSKPPIPLPTNKKPSESVEPYNRSRYWTYVRDPKKAFGEFYTFCYKLATQPGSRNIEMETAVALWSVVLAPTQPIVTEVSEFVNEAGSYKAVNKDLWAMVFEFSTTMKPDLSNYEADGAWPTMIDDFVEWKKARDRSLGEQPMNTD